MKTFTLLLGASLAATALADEAPAVSRGQYLARLGDCAACHTAVQGPLFAGGLAIESPLGRLYSTNITPDRQTGIGEYSLDDFRRAVTEGVRKDGTSLYPAMPYPSYARMSEADIAALYDYFMHEVPAVAVANRSVDIPWPLSMRWPLRVWRAMYAPTPVPFDGSRYADAQVARGAYIVQGPGHCGSCHTDRGLALQEKALDDRDGAAYLAGGSIIDGWSTPNLRGNARGGLGAWTEEDLVRFLKTGRTDHTAAFGGMVDVIAWSTQYLTDDDLQAVAKYLKTLPADGPQPARQAPVGVLAGSPGEQGYLDHCALCHGADGQGVARMFPALAGNNLVINDQPQSLLKIILEGASLPPSHWAPSTVHMPGYASVLSDQQVAAIGNYVRQAWGNEAKAQLTAQAVAQARTPQVEALGKDRADIGWQTVRPQPYGSQWSFSIQPHGPQDNRPW
ncbi:c-type cytochrome [Pseudomonas putida]